jgi:hypothetical protein
MDDPVKRGDEPRLDASSPETVVRVVLAEADAPGSLHYLIEAEGFRVVGCASDDLELGRVLEQNLQPDVIVLDTDISATAVLVASEKSPSSHVIVIWPDGVQLPSAAERVEPRLVYELLGPAIRHAANERRRRHPTAVEPREEPQAIPNEPIASVDGADSGLRHAASRFSVTTVALVAAIVLTMGASFALEGWNAPDHAAPSRSTGPTAVRSSPTISPTTSEQQPDVHEPNPEPCSPPPKSDPQPPNARAATNVRSADDPTCRPRRGGTANRPTHPSDNSVGPAHPNEKDHGRGNSNEAGSGGNGGAAHGNGGGGSHGDQSGAHGRPEHPRHRRSPQQTGEPKQGR